MTAKTNIDKLTAIDREVKATAVTYFKKAKDAEEFVEKYSQIKFCAETSYSARRLVFD